MPLNGRGIKDRKEGAMMRLEKITSKLKNNVKKERRILTKLQNGSNTPEETQNLIQQMSEINTSQENVSQCLDNECIKGRMRRIRKEVKTHPAAYAMYLETKHRRPGRGRSKTVK